MIDISIFYVFYFFNSEDFSLKKVELLCRFCY